MEREEAEGGAEWDHEAATTHSKDGGVNMLTVLIFEEGVTRPYS